MSKLERMKERYDQIAIPEELHIRVQQEIQKSRAQQEEKRKEEQSMRFKRAIRGMGAAAAAACVLFTAALNTSQVFAQEAGQIPVIGGLARILTFRAYETEKDEIAVSVEIPTIEMIAQDTGIEVDAVNQEILASCNRYADEALQRAEEYRTAFLETGGTLEEWAEHNIKITVGYEIKQQSDAYLSFVVRGSENWTGAYNESRYYNLDLKSGKMVTLKDMLGSDYVKLVNESIREQMDERQKAGDIFFTEEEGGFTGISEDAKFYINENNRPVIVFEKYKIAPGSSGEITFEIGVDPAETEAKVEPVESEEGAKAEPVESEEGAKVVPVESEAEAKAESGGSEAAQAGYEDNFAVDSGAAKEFARKVQTAASQKDLETFSELSAFPIYVGLSGVDIVETREEFLKLGAETVFTDELLESLENADIENFQPSMAGFSISDGGTANVNFGVVDGRLAVNGVNY